MKFQVFGGDGELLLESITEEELKDLLSKAEEDGFNYYAYDTTVFAGLAADSETPCTQFCRVYKPIEE